VFDHTCLRRILKVRWTDRLSNDAVRDRCKMSHLDDILVTGRLRWFGHAVRHTDSEPIHKAIAPVPPAHWRKRRGGQRKSWLSTVKQELERTSGPRIFDLRRWKRDWLGLVKADSSNCAMWRRTIREFKEEPAEPIMGDSRLKYK